MNTEQLTETAVTYGTRVIGIVLFLFAAWIVAGWLGRIVVRAFERANVDLTIARFFGRLARYAILTMALLGCLGAFGVQTTSFAAVIGATGLAIGLAMQGSLSNLSAGVMLLIFRPFKVGDFVNVAGQAGTVYEIELFTTALDTPDNRRIILPNSTIFGNVIENITYHERRRVDVGVGVAYTADLDRTREVLEGAVAQVDGVLADPPAQVMLNELGDSAVTWTVRAWAAKADFWPVRERLVRAVKQALDGAGLSIPFPQMDVHLDAPALVERLGADGGMRSTQSTG